MKFLFLAGFALGLLLMLASIMIFAGVLASVFKFAGILCAALSLYRFDIEDLRPNMRGLFSAEQIDK